MVGTFRSPFSEAGATLRSYHSAINSNVTFLTGDCREVRAHTTGCLGPLLRHQPTVLGPAVLHGRFRHDWARAYLRDEHLENLVAA